MSGPSKRRDAPADPPLSPRFASARDYRKGQEWTAPDADSFPPVISRINPSPRQVEPVLPRAGLQQLPAWWNGMGFCVNRLSAEMRGPSRADVSSRRVGLGVVVTRPRRISSLNLNFSGPKCNSRYACQSDALTFDQTWHFNNGC